MPADPLRSLRDAVASDPDDAIARGRLAELLLAAGSVTEAFSHLAVAYELGLSDPASARHTQFVLESVAAIFARDAGRATGPGGRAGHRTGSAPSLRRRSHPHPIRLPLRRPARPA